MRSALRMIALLLIGAVVADPLIAGDKLSSIRSDVHSEASPPATPSAPAKPPRRSHDKHGSYFGSSDCEDDEGDSLTGQLFGMGLLGAGFVATSPFWAPYSALNDEYSRDAWFPKHPYRASDGAVVYDESIRGSHDWLTVLQGQHGTDFDDMMLWNGRAIIEHKSRWGIDTEFNYRQEELAGGGHDELWNGDFNITFRFAQSENWLFRAGAGVNWLHDRGETENGFNFTYGAEWFPVKPLVFTGTMDLGKISGDGLLHLRTTAGITTNGFGFYTGYDYFRISNNGISSWINGIELRF